MLSLFALDSNKTNITIPIYRTENTVEQFKELFYDGIILTIVYLNHRIQILLGIHPTGAVVKNEPSGTRDW